MPPKKATQALHQYFDALTNDTSQAASDELANASALLQQANQSLIAEQLQGAASENISRQEAFVDKEITEAADKVCIEKEIRCLSLKDKLPARFQALFFELGGLSLAIPLTELGGIVEMGKLSKPPSKASWLLGVLLRQNERLNCVDTARWVMPEKFNTSSSPALNYRFVIQLNKSSWALACEKLADTHELVHDDIKWRSQDNKQPWLAGTIKQKMCALIDASQLIKVLQTPHVDDAKSVVPE